MKVSSGGYAEAIMELNQQVNRVTVAGRSDIDMALPRPVSTCTVVGRSPPRSRMVKMLQRRLTGAIRQQHLDR